MFYERQDWRARLRSAAIILCVCGQLMNGRLLEGDRKTMARGRARWQVMVRRARKHLVKEGLLEDDTGLNWTITPTGRKAAAGGKSKKE